MTANGEAIAIRGVTKYFGDYAAVADLTLAVPRGSVYGFIGPNGSGKTTTLRMTMNILFPDAGEIVVLGERTTAAARDRVSYLPEERGLYKRMKVGDQLRFFAELKNFSGRAADEAIDRWLAKVKLSEWKRKKSSELSKGMQQKTQFVAAVLHDPDLLILDEPFSGLDPVSSELLIELVLELKASGKTIIFSTHQMEVAERVCDDICLINRSRKVLDGSIREVKRGFGRNSVALRFEGGEGEGVLEDRSLVAGVKRHADEIEALLAPAADPQEVLRRLLASGARVTKFELVEPSLHDIFIEKVGGGE
jgi:ABC-2 type transport system ATP-binding protein